MEDCTSFTMLYLSSQRMQSIIISPFEFLESSSSFVHFRHFASMMDSLDKLLYILSGVILSFLVPPIIRFCTKRKSELYEDSDSILLNAQLSSRWMNMGLWDETDDFPTACSGESPSFPFHDAFRSDGLGFTALARKVGAVGDQRAGQRILVRSSFVREEDGS